MVNKGTKIYIAGHKGMVGSACWRALENKGYTSLVGVSSKELDLRNQNEVNDFIQQERPDVIIDSAAKVGGILANSTFPYSFLMDNILIQANLIGAANKYGVEKFIFLGSSCIFPKFAPQPLKEEYLLTGELEPTNQWYAIAKITGVKLIEALRNEFGYDYVSLMPTNLYGPHDNYDLTTSHVLPAMIRKFHKAKTERHSSVTLWGSGDPLREFLHVDDLANAVLFALDNQLPDHLYNVGSGTDLSIKELALMVGEITGYEGDVLWDKTKPDGTYRKLMDSSKMRDLGWQPNYDLRSGIENTYAWFLDNLSRIKEIKY